MFFSMGNYKVCISYTTKLNNLSYVCVFRNSLLYLGKCSFSFSSFFLLPSVTIYKIKQTHIGKFLVSAASCVYCQAAASSQSSVCRLAFPCIPKSPFLLHLPHTCYSSHFGHAYFFFNFAKTIEIAYVQLDTVLDTDENILWFLFISQDYMNEAHQLVAGSLLSQLHKTSKKISGSF